MTQVICESEARSPTSYYCFETTRDPEDGMSPISRWWNRAFSWEDQSASIVGIPIPPNSRVLRVALEISAAFTGTTAVIVGDQSDADDGWIETGVITPTTVGDFGFDYDAAYSVKGRFHADGDTIDVEFAGIATAGEGILWVEMISYAEASGAEDTS